MKKVQIKITSADTPKRNELHFEVQKNTRATIVESKKKYDRKKMKQRDLRGEEND